MMNPFRSILSSHQVRNFCALSVCIGMIAPVPADALSIVFNCKDASGKQIFTDKPELCKVGNTNYKITQNIPKATAAAIIPVAPAKTVVTSKYGNYQRLFSAQSLWNSRPVRPVFGTYEIPKSSYYPVLHEGSLSTGIFLAKSTDSAVTVYAPDGSGGIWDPDSGYQRASITIPRWPSDVVGASGDDGHADIVDPASNKIHSFYRLRKNGSRWTASHYAWTPIDGTGWSNPAHYYQGVRAVSGPPSAGVIRKHEIGDNLDVFEHALAISMTYNGLASAPGYIFPATSADNGVQGNSGKIPEGALLMLPANYPTEKIKDPVLRKVANTLKVYGGYVVDRNTGTPFAIYVENGSGVNLHKNGWNQDAALALDDIRAKLRQVISSNGFIDGDNKNFTPVVNQNILSMRGPWALQDGTELGKFDTWEQAVIFGKTTKPTKQLNGSVTSMYSVNTLSSITWAAPKVGDKFKLTSIAKGGAKVRFMILDSKKQWKVVYDTGELADGQSATFTWPTSSFHPNVQVISGVGASSSASASLVKVSE